MAELEPVPRLSEAGCPALRPIPQVFGGASDSAAVSQGQRRIDAADEVDLVSCTDTAGLLDRRFSGITAGFPPAARIFCAETVKVPAAGDYRFEPVIISPTSFLWPRLRGLPIALLLTSGWIVQITDEMGLRSPMLPWLVLFTLVGILAMAWLWRTTVRPTYVRLAPGVVQVLEYRLRSSKPTIRSYPMLPGTLVIVRQDVKARRPTSVQFVRGEQSDVLPVSQMKDPDDAMQHIWYALLSTAPTPPLSDEELVG